MTDASCFDPVAEREATARARVVAEALGWLGTPYHHHGRVRGVGVDCGMLLAEVYERAGVVGRVDAGGYSPQWHLHRGEEVYEAFMSAYAHRVQTPAVPQPGDIATFKFGRCFSHGGIFVEPDLLVHAYLGSA